MRPRTFLLLFVLALAACDGRSPMDPLGGHSAAISGVVANKYGSVWGGVSVGIVTEEGVVGSGVTGDDGRYSIGGLRPGHYRIWLQLGRTGPGSFVGEVDLHEGHNTFDIVTQ